MISTGGWIGLAGGLAFAIFDYWLVVHVARKNLQSNDPEVVDQKLRPVKLAMGAGIVVLPVLGCLLGNMLAEQGILPR